MYPPGAVFPNMPQQGNNPHGSAPSAFPKTGAYASHSYGGYDPSLQDSYKNYSQQSGSQQQAKSSMPNTGDMLGQSQQSYKGNQMNKGYDKIGGYQGGNQAAFSASNYGNQYMVPMQQGQQPPILPLHGLQSDASAGSGLQGQSPSGGGMSGGPSAGGRGGGHPNSGNNGKQSAGGGGYSGQGYTGGNRW
jgi:hypothetical protein